MDQQPKTSDLSNQQSRVRKLFGEKSANYAGSSLLVNRENLAQVMDIVGINENDMVLDVATGTGYMAVAAAEAHSRVVATDFTLEMLLETRKALEAWQSNTDLSLMDADRLAFSGNSFDAVTCRVSLHHFVNPENAVGEMARVCKTGCRVIIMDVVSSEDKRKSELHNEMGKMRDPSEVRQWQTSEIQRMMKKAGLSIDRVESWSHEMAFDEWISLGEADAETAAHLKKMMIDSIEGDKAGLSPRFIGDELFFTWTTAIILGKK